MPLKHIDPKNLSISLVIQIFIMSTFAQQNESCDGMFSVSVLFQHEININYNHTLMQDLNPDFLRLKKLIKKEKLLVTPLQFEKPSYDIWQNATFNSLNLTGGIRNANFILYPLLERNAFYVSGMKESMPSISSMNSMTIGFKLQATDNWVINISSSAVKFGDMFGIHNDFTVNVTSYISLSDYWWIILYGGYSMNGKNNVIEGVNMKSPFAPNSYFGGSIEHQFSRKFSIEAGMRREYNPWLKEWENVYYVTPKFSLDGR